METRNEDDIMQGSLVTRNNHDQSVSRRSFQEHVAKYGFPNSSSAKQTHVEHTGSPEPQTPSPAPKRKRSRGSNQKQTSDLDCNQSSAQEPESPSAKRKSTPRSRKASSTSTPVPPSTPIISKLCDSLRPKLNLVLIGLNPGIMTANLGHPYSHPSNGFWKILYSSGITPIQHRPQDHPLLPDLYGIGNTNICARPSRLGSDLSKAELSEGARILDEKIARYRPEAACISGKGVWEAIWSFKTGRKKMPKDGEGAFRYGWQDEELWLGRTVDGKSGDVLWKGAKTFVAPSTSGLNAGMSPAEKEEAWRPIGEWMRKRREEEGTSKETTRTAERRMLDIAGVIKGSGDSDPSCDDKIRYEPG